MILMLLTVKGKKILIDYEDVISAEEIGPGDTLIRLARRGQVYTVHVKDSVDEIYDLLPYDEDDDDC